jgi:hypothetical protein
MPNDTLSQHTNPRNAVVLSLTERALHVLAVDRPGCRESAWQRLVQSVGCLGVQP